VRTTAAAADARSVAVVVERAADRHRHSARDRRVDLARAAAHHRTNQRPSQLGHLDARDDRAVDDSNHHPAPDGDTAAEPAYTAKQFDAMSDAAPQTAQDVQRDGPVVTGMQKWVGVIGLFVAPTTVVTALCYYFGYLYTRKYFAYFGVDANAIGFSTSDYVIRSVTALYVPVLAFVFCWVAVLWAGFYLRRLAQTGRRNELLRRTALALIAVGMLGLLRGVLGMTLPQYAFPRNAALTPLTAGLGAAAIVVGSWLLVAMRTGSAPQPFATVARATLLAAAGIMVLALFWITGNLASHYGEEQAKSTAAGLWKQETAVVLDTSERLSAPKQLIRETALDSADAGRGIRFRYRCFRALVVKDGRWVLIPAAWEPPHGYAVIVTTDATTRVSFWKYAGIDDTAAGNWDLSRRADGWPCPEAGPH
jgi:hypothetical protein